MSFHKILIANRGEIACRVIRTARRMGYATVAVFSDADRQAPHVGLADEAVYVGPAQAAQSYLNMDALLQAAQKTGADAVHPGYGFLSENAAFARACEGAGLVFIGPPASAMEAMADKAQAKRRMLAAGVPCAPGYLGGAQDNTTLSAQALQLGFPLLVKAVAGGGGRGMRLVRCAADLDAALEGARREAHSAFGDSTLMLERLIEDGRHIEVQVFADAHGQAIYLGERDCTAQRRRQKVIEEAPSPVVSQAMREAMGRDAVAAALAVGYRGAGTVEFIVDQRLQHYFLEMNTRLQVEHPVTEMVTGLDLVEWQLRVAANEPLPLRQDQVQWQGHAIEARLYAEDPYAGFAPQTGPIRWWQPEGALARGVRVDDGIRQGDAVSPHYDPMVAKLIAHGRDRPDAIRRLRAALAATPLLGVGNNARFLHDLLGHAAFQNAAMHTTMIDDWQAQGLPLLQRPQPSDEAWWVAGMVLAQRQAMRPGAQAWRPNSVNAWSVQVRCGDETRALRLRPDIHGHVEVTDAETQRNGQVLHFDEPHLRYEYQGVQRQAVALIDGAVLHLALGIQTHVFEELTGFPQSTSVRDPGRAVAPVAGRVTQLAVVVGESVAQGQQLVCVEAMKMEMWVTAQAAGTVTTLHARVGEQVAAGALLLELHAAMPGTAHC